MREHLATIGKGIVSLALFVALAFVLDLAHLLDRLQHADLRLVLAASLLVAFGYVLCGLRWAWIAEGLGLDVSRRRKIRLFFVGMFASLFLPSTIGGDALRALLLAQGRQRAGWRAGASVILDRANGLLALVVLIGVALLASNAVPRSIAWGWLLGTAGAGFAAVMLATRFFSAAVPLHSPLFRQRFLQSLPISALFQLLIVAAHALLGKAVGLSLAWHDWIIVVGLSALAATLPISLNGLGVREAGYVGLTAWLGGDAEAAAAMAALWVAVLALSAAPGGLFLWRIRRKEQNR